MVCSNASFVVIDECAKSGTGSRYRLASQGGALFRARHRASPAAKLVGSGDVGGLLIPKVEATANPQASTTVGSSFQEVQANATPAMAPASQAAMAPSQASLNASQQTANQQTANQASTARPAVLTATSPVIAHLKAVPSIATNTLISSTTVRFVIQCWHEGLPVD
jgi:hypothetical protein